MRCKVFTFLFLLLQATPLICQTAQADSVELALDTEALYSLSLNRVDRWLKGAKDADQRQQILDLKDDAQQFFTARDVETALLMVESAEQLIKAFKQMEAEPAVQETAEAPESTTTELIKSIITGVDFWQQRFEYAFSDEANVSSEKSANPFVGVRLQGKIDSPEIGEFSAFAQAKNSRDYRSGELDLKHMIGNYSNNHWLIENRLEGTKYVREFDLAYWENTTSFQGGFKPSSSFQFLFGDDFRVRNYSTESTLYSDYRQNIAWTGVQYVSGLSTRAYGRYHYTNRRHSGDVTYDYDEHRVDASIYQSTAINSSIYFENIWTKRDYLNLGFGESYINSYEEEYVLGDIRFGMTPKVSLGLRGNFNLRQYNERTETVENDVSENLKLFTPDYIHVEANPRFLFNIFGDWQLGIGYLYTLRVYSKDMIETTTNSSTDAASVSDYSIEFEDYYANGLSVSVELFSYRGFMLSLTDQFEERRYPNAPQTTGNLFNSDRRVNSVLLFSSLTLTPQWELSALANFDNDRGIKADNSDSMNTLLSFDLSFSF